MAKPAAVAVAEDVFAETPAVAAAPTLAVIEVTAPVTPAALPVPEGWVYVEFLESYFSATDKTLNFGSVEEIYAHINKASIEAYVDQFMAHVEANPRAYFLVEAKPERNAKKDHLNEAGEVVLAKGTKIPAEPAHLMTGVALDSAKTRLRSAAAKLVAWQYQQQAIQA
jgi:hypothetical protein